MMEAQTVVFSAIQRMILNALKARQATLGVIQKQSQIVKPKDFLAVIPALTLVVRNQVSVATQV